MSQHFKSNTDLSNNSNFDDAIGGMIGDLSRHESNATDESSTSTYILPNNMGNITLMGLNHLQSSPLQPFINPNINAPKLVIPPSKVQLPPDTTPGNDNNKSKNDNNNKPSEVQIHMETEDDESKNDNGNIPHPITPNTDPSYDYQSGISPLPPQQRGITQNDMAQLAEINQFIPEFWQCFQTLANNVNTMQRQLSKLQADNNNKSQNLSSRSSTQTRYRSQSNSSTNSLRTQTSIASSYNNTQSFASHGVIYSNSTNDSLYNTRKSLIINPIAPGVVNNKNERASSRRNRKTSPKPNNNKNKNKKPHFLEAHSQNHSISKKTYNSYSQYRYPRRKSIGPGNSGKSKNGSISPFASSPKGNSKKYMLTADSLELLHVSQRQSNSNKSKKPNRRQRNRSKSFVASKNKKGDMNNKKRRTTIADANENKMSNEENNPFSDDDFFDDEVSLYSDNKYSNTMNSAISVLESQPIQQKLSIISNNKKVYNNNNGILFEDFEGNGNQKLRDKFHRKKKDNINNKASSRKPSSSNSSSGHMSNQSQFSISSIAITDNTENDTIILSRSVPHSPDSHNLKFNKSYFLKDKRRASQGSTNNHLYPTSKTTDNDSIPKISPTLTQSHSAHNINTTTVTATITPTPQRPNTPTNQKHKNDIITPNNTPKPFITPNYIPKPILTPNNTPNIVSPPMSAYDISYSDNQRHNKNNRRRNSLTPPQEDKEHDDYLIQHSQRVHELQVEPLIFTDDNMNGNDSDCLYNDKIRIVDDDEMIINGDKVQDIPIYGGNNNKLLNNNMETNNMDNDKDNIVEQAANILFTTSLLPLTKYTPTDEQQNGEDSVSISMNSTRYDNSRPGSTKLNKNVHFDMNTLNKMDSIDDIEENKESADDIEVNHNLLPSQVKNHKKKNKNGYNRVTKLKNAIAYNSLKNKNKRGNLRRLRLSQQNLHAHNGLNQLKNKLMDAKVEKKDVAKMTNEQLNEMLIYINRIQWLILDEKQKRESCVICGYQTNLFALLLPCKHTNICFNCSSNLKDCPTCQKNISQTILPRNRR